MILDHLTNLKTYQGISDGIYAGLIFLHQQNIDIEIGVYQINSRVKDIVSEYETKVKNEVGFEAYRNNIGKVTCRSCVLMSLKW